MRKRPPVLKRTATVPALLTAAQRRGIDLPPTRSGEATLVEMDEPQIRSLAIGDQALWPAEGVLVTVTRFEDRMWGELGNEEPCRLVFAPVNGRERSFSCDELVTVEVSVACEVGS